MHSASLLGIILIMLLEILDIYEFH